MRVADRSRDRILGPDIDVDRGEVVAASALQKYVKATRRKVVAASAISLAVPARPAMIAVARPGLAAVAARARSLQHTRRRS